MEHLTKQQIVLLTLFTSFVTSIATGIVTVSLMDQAPTGVTQTINRVVERTIERVVSETPPTTTAAVANIDSGSVSQAVAKVRKSIVSIKPRGGSSDTVKGFGIMLSEDGLFITDKAALTPEGGEFVVVLPSGAEYPLQIVQSEIIGDKVFAAALFPRDVKAVPVIWSGSDTSIQLGDRVFSLSGKDLSSMEEGLIKKAPGASPEKSGEAIETTIPSAGLLLGSPLFTAKGEVVGYKTSALLDTSSFQPVSSLKAIMPFFVR